MLMLTHTYLLQKTIKASSITHIDPDIYIYNIAPDLLTIHPDISAVQTHTIDRFVDAPADHARCAYIMFHLLVDDLAHYGKISMACRKDGFDPEASGFSYIKGRPLIDDLIALHKIIPRDITYNEAAYRSHLIIEMIYDLVILARLREYGSMELLEEAIQFVRNRREEEFCAEVAWLYGFDKDSVRDVLKQAVSYITRDRMEKIMNIEGRIRLFTDKFGLRNDSTIFREAIETLFSEAIQSIGQDDFIAKTGLSVKETGWLPTI